MTTRTRRVLLAAAAAVLVAGTSTAQADPPVHAGAGATFVLSGNPHVPLAVVHGHTITSAFTDAERSKGCGDKRRWAQRGSAWTAVDAWGQVFGTYRIRGSELYDATGCREVQLTSPPQSEETRLYISSDSSWHEPRSAEWVPSAEERRSLHVLSVRLEEGQTDDELPSTLSELHAQARFFEVPAGAGKSTRMAVAGRCGGWLVAEQVGTSWKVVTRKLQERPELRECYRPMAVFDLDGDGTPEIVLRFIEGGGEWWGERVVRRAADGTWSSVALSGGGSTA